MRAMVVRKYGAPEVFEAREVPDPQPKAGEALIRVKAIGVNFADLLQRMGIYPGTPKPPFVPGMEVAGVVEKVAESGGKSAEGEPLRPGEAVAALTQFNAYASWVAVPARQVYRLPAGMPFDDAAAIPGELFDRLPFDVCDGQPAARRQYSGSWSGWRRGNRGGAACASSRSGDFRHGGTGQTGIPSQNRRGPCDRLPEKRFCRGGAQIRAGRNRNGDGPDWREILFAEL